MKTHEILNAGESQLVSRLKQMTLTELEGHARSIMQDMGSDDFPGIMTHVMKVVEKPVAAGQSQFEIVQTGLREKLPYQSYDPEVYARLATLVMMIIAQRFREIYQSNS